jgi:hypothetical protein
LERLLNWRSSLYCQGQCNSAGWGVGSFDAQITASDSGERQEKPIQRRGRQPCEPCLESYGALEVCSGSKTQSQSYPWVYGHLTPQSPPRGRLTRVPGFGPPWGSFYVWQLGPRFEVVLAAITATMAYRFIRSRLGIFCGQLGAKRGPPIR